jgi:DNA-binding LacI/PurR family transcriptional regulator
MATITDVAELAKVSKNTVSRYLNNRGYISQQTRDNIQQAIDFLHYRPNQIARSLYSNKTNIVGLVIPDVTQPFFAKMASLIEDELDKNGYRMILCNTMHSSVKEQKYIDLLIGNKVDGIIIGSHSVDINYKDIDAPIVALDRWLADDIPVVSANHTQGGILAAQAMMERNCKNVVQLVANSKVLSPSSQRHQVFAEQMKANGIRCLTYELKLNQFEFQTYLETADDFFNENPEVDGIFASDLVALAFQKKALERGIQIPQDLFLFGYDGSFVYQTAYPELPTVVQPYKELSETIVHVLVEKMSGKQLSRLSYTLPVKLSKDEQIKSEPNFEPRLLTSFPD